MSKNKINIDVKVDDKGTTKKVGLGAKNAAKGLDKAANSADNYSKKQKGVAGSTSNSTKAFSKMQQGTGGLVAAYATLAASLFAVSAAFNFLKRAGDLKILQQGQVAYSSATGVAMKSLTSDIIAATDAQVTFQDASQAAAIGIASGLDPDQLIRLGKAAKDASAMLGRDVTDSFNRLVRGVTKAEPELLDELGIILRLETASKNYAIAINKDVKALTTFEKSQAVTNEVLRQAEEKYGRIMDITSVGTNRYAKLGKAFDDVTNKLKLLAEKAMGPLADLLIETPKLALLAFGLLMKPVLTAVLPGLANVAAATAAIATTADASFKSATKRAEDYQKALNARKPDVDPKVAQAGVAGALKGVPRGASRSILAQAQAGKQLSNRQIKILKEEVSKKKLLRGKELRDFRTHLRNMQTANTMTNRRMVADFNNAQEQKKLGLTKFELFAKSSMAKVAAFGAGAAKFMSVAFSAIGWFGMLASIFMVVKGLFSQEEATEEVIKATDRLGDKMREVSADLKHFVVIQKEINREGAATGAVIMNIGKAFSNYSAGDIEKLTKGINFSASAVQGLQLLDAAAAGSMKKLSDLKTKLDDLGTGKQNQAARQALQTDIRKLKGTMDTPASQQYRDSLEAQIAPTEEFRTQLTGVLNVLNMETDAKLKNSAQGKELHKVLTFSLAGRKLEEGALLAAILNYINLGKEIAQVTKLRIENARTGQAFRDKLFPKTEAEKYLQTLNSQLVLEKSIQTSNALEAETQQKRIKGLTDEISLITELNTQKLRHASETQKLNIGQTLDAPDIEFPGLKKRREELNKVANAELKLDQMREQAQLKKNMLQTVVNPTVAQLGEMEKINDAVLLQEDLVRRANLALTDGAKIANNLAGSIESNMTSAFTGLINGTMTVKEAFASMAQGILNSLASVIAELITVKLLKMAIGGFSFGGSAGDMQGVTGNYSQPTMMGSTSAYARNGGVFSEGAKVQGYSAGGVASGSTSGYPAVLHGTEAVVPLPNGNSIPVEMKGAGSGTTNNNITVNVASDGQTTTQGGKGMDMDKMGAAVAAAVQKELQNQKRSGGILNPYGAA